MSHATLDRNLLSLSHSSSMASALIAGAKPDSRVSFATSKTGVPVPLIQTRQGCKALHSRFDPHREGIRLAQSCNMGETVLAYGLGGAYHLLPLLENTKLVSLFIIDTDASLIRSILENLELSQLFLDPRVVLCLPQNPEETRTFLLNHYVPVLSGNLRSLSLRSRVELDHAFFMEAAQIIKDALSSIQDDYAVQTHFGKKWFTNTLSNLKTSEGVTTTLKPVNKVQITAAGPSLEKQLPRLLKDRKDSTLIATDTSLPVLLKQNIKPDMVISIDCQHISYHHFMKGYPAGIPLVLDLASPPFLTRIAPKCFFFTSDHPFSSYVSRHFRRFPHLDTSGGNVTYAALSLAEALGAKEIHLYGADFSYPMGKAYARGSYIYPFFFHRADRMQGIESQSMNFVLHNKSISKENCCRGFRYISKPMIHYRRSLEKKAADINARIIVEEGDGVKLNFPLSRSVKSKNNQFMSAGPSMITHRLFIADFLEKVKSLPEPKASLAGYLNGLNSKETNTLYTLLPIAAQFRKNSENGMEALLKARNWSISVLKRFPE